MKYLYCGKDGGKDSPVTGFWLIELKTLFSVALLKFNPGCRENFHSHAFNSISWVLWGELVEEFKDGRIKKYKPSLISVITTREDFHKVSTTLNQSSWVLTFRGPWSKTWKEFNLKAKVVYTLEKHRKIIQEQRTGE